MPSSRAARVTLLPTRVSARQITSRSAAVRAWPNASAYHASKWGLLGLSRTLAKDGGKRGVRTHVVCPGFVRSPLVDKQIPEQARTLGISEDEVIKNVMLKETVDGEFTTTEDVARVALLFAGFPSNALTGQSLVVSHGWFMQ